METKVEGILIYKIPYRERDLLTRLLLRNGKKISVVFYGGRSGGKKNRSSFLELGHFLGIELRKKTKGHDQDLFEAKECSLKWSYSRIRFNIKAYYLMVFFCELADKLALKVDLNNYQDIESIGPFRILSSALYYLEDALKDEDFDILKIYGAYLGRFLYELGVAPLMTNCLNCEESFGESPSIGNFSFEGGFSCLSCQDAVNEKYCNNALQENVSASQKIYFFLSLVKKLPFANYSQLPSLDFAVMKELFKYLCYQFNISEKEFKSSRYLQ